MDEMTLLQEFRAAVAPPGEPVLARARARMTDGGAPGQDHPRRQRLRLRGTRGRFALTGLAGLAGAATAATAAAVVMSVASSGGGAFPAGTASPAVKEMAYRAATAAAARPGVVPGQWVYWQEKTPDQAYEVWTTADGTRAAYVYQGKMAFVPCFGPHAEQVDSCQYHRPDERHDAGSLRRPELAAPGSGRARPVSRRAAPAWVGARAGASVPGSSRICSSPT